MRERGDPARQGWVGEGLPYLRLQLLPAQSAAGALAGRLAVAPYRSAVDEDVLDAGGRGHRRLEGGAVGDRRGVEDGDVGRGPGRDGAPAGQAKPGGREAGHAAHRFLQPEQPEIAAVMAENP